MRGHVYRAEITRYGPKPYVVVSNNNRNRKLDSVLASRITTTDKSHVVSAVRLGRNDPLVGFVLADEIVELFDEDIEAATFMGALSGETILSLNEALKLALGIP